MTPLYNPKEEEIQGFPFVLPLFYLSVVSVFIYDSGIYWPPVYSVLQH